MPKIAAISDIHWRGITRHEEYTKAFETLFQQLRTEVKPDYIFCLGDSYHTKTQGITPEVVDKLSWMFNSLAEIAPVYSILGNHDGNLTNEDRQDTISPIVSAINSPRITLFKRSGNHIIPGTNINLCVLSCFDEPGWHNVQTDNDLINIALFHGSVRGCQTDSDWVMTSGEVNISMFEQYDFAMLGDIHKAQFLGYRPHSGITRDLKPWIGYPGSLIQQNYGEDTVKGYHVWDIRSATDWNVEFKQVPNDYQFMTVQWKGDVKSTVAEAASAVNYNLSHKRVRVSSDQTIFHLQMKELYDELKNKLKASEVVFKADKKQISEASNDEDTHKKTTSLRNSPDTLCELYDAFVSKDYKIPLTVKQNEEAKEYIRKSLEKVKQSEDDVARDVVWSIKDLEWSNLYRYGEDNQINFQNLSGITGIFGPNKIGKSSIVGSLMFGLFNTTDRGPVKSAYIINKNKREGFAKATINVSGTDYIIERSVAKASKRAGKYDEEKAATKLTLSRINSNGSTEELVSENSDSRTDTDKVVRKLIGNSQDFLLTAFSNQGGMNRFIDEGATQRKAILNRFLDMDIFEKIYKMANEDLQGFNAISKKFQSVNWDEDKADYEGKIADCNLDILTAKQELEAKKVQRDKLRGWLQKHGADKQSDLRKGIAAANTSISKLEKSITQKSEEREKFVANSESIEQELDLARTTIENIQPDELQKQSDNLQKLSEDYNDLKLNVDAEKSKLAAQVKSIKKLDLVPCNTSFPDCHYIKDSHTDKANHEAQKKIVEDILSAFQNMKADFEALKSQKFDEQIKAYNRTVQDIERLEDKIKYNQSMVKSCDDHIKLLAQQLTETISARDNLTTELEKQEDLGSGVEEEKTLGIAVRDLESKLQALYVKLGGFTTKLDQLTKEATEAARIVEEQKVYDSIVQAFSKNGIPAYVLKNKLPEINTELNNILAGIVSFRVFLETEVGSNTLDVFLEDKDSRRVIELASGMEKMIASLAIRVALISLSSLPKPDIFIQDEGYGNLDSANIAKVIELLHTIKNRFRAILVISHVDEIKEAANTIINITDNGTESNVVF